MNVFVVTVCVNLITLVNAAYDINFDSILKILKQKHGKSGYSNIDETNEPIEAIPIIPGFYLQKPKDLSKSLFENPKDWPDDLFSILNSKGTKTRHNNKRISAKAVNKNPRDDDYLKDEILKGVKNLDQYRPSQKSSIEKITKTNTYKEGDYEIYKKDILKKSNAYDAQKEPVTKLLGRVFQGIKGGIKYRGKGNYRNKKPRNQHTSSKNEKQIGKILKNLLYGSINNKKYRGSEKYHYRYYETEENSQNTGNLLGNIVDAIQNHDQGQESAISQRPATAMVIISSASLHDNDFESENNAKESMEISDEDFDGSDSLSLYHTRRKITSKSSSDSDDSSASTDYERNPGNPFTVHKNKYKQNWPYNHYMDGDHMNINPFGPQFGKLGPTGPELFFGRKWWYFNQDDYKPMG